MKIEESSNTHLNNSENLKEVSSLKNSNNQFGWVSIALHWTLAIVLIAMYFAGDYMVGLDYYDTWYHRAPLIHKEVGVTIGALMIFRLLWNALQVSPQHIGDASRKGDAVSKVMAKAAHYFLYALVFSLVVSGYLISTAKGQGIDVFGWFELPALLPDDKDRGELAGWLHEWIGLGFIALVAIHGLAALLHHFVFKDRTLKRMLKVQKSK